MTWNLDARIPLVFGAVADLGPDDAILMLGDAPAPTGHAIARCPVSAAPEHAIGCACCAPRGAVAAALGELFLRRARGEVTFFRRVVCLAVDDATRAAVGEALREDAVAAGRFREG